MDVTEVKYFIEAALLAAGRPLSIDQLKSLFDDDAAPEKAQIREALGKLEDEYAPRGIAVGEVASGFRMQVKSAMAERLSRLWEERPPRYSRALFETLALIAYRQPMTRGEIEEIRGVAVSSNIIRSLLEREWIRVVGHRDVPGRPSMFGTTRQFLDYFGLKKLEELPPLADLADWETLRVQLNLPAVDEQEMRDETADVRSFPVSEADRNDTGDLPGDTEARPGSAEATDDDEAAPDIADDDAADAGEEVPTGSGAESGNDGQRAGQGSGNDARDDEVDTDADRASVSAGNV